jgi:hypothetical protein
MDTSNDIHAYNNAILAFGYQPHQPKRLALLSFLKYSLAHYRRGASRYLRTTADAAGFMSVHLAASLESGSRIWR